MRTRFIIALLALAGWCSAQPYSGDIYTVCSAGILSRVTQAGQLTTLVDVNTAAKGIAVNYDNQGILWSEYGSTVATIASSIREWRGGADTVLFSTTDYAIEELLVDQRGDVVFSGTDQSQTPSVTGVFRWNGGTSVSTITTTAAFGISRSSLDGGMDVNIHTGNYLVASAFAVPGQVWDIADDGTVTSLVTTTTTTPAAGRYSLSQDKRTGTIYQSGFLSYRYVDSSGVQSSLIRPTGPRYDDTYYSIRVGRASVPDSARLLYSTHQTTSTFTAAIYQVANPDGPNPSFTVTPLTLIQTGTTYGMVFADERNIGSLKTGPGAYTLNFNFPGEGGSSFVSAVSASGFHPGFQLPDGRNVCLNVDALFVTSVQGLLAPFYQGAGTLDANGNGSGSIALGADDLGVLVHIVCLTLSGGNITTVSAPYPMKL